jgi:hypothetical protein
MRQVEEGLSPEEAGCAVLRDNLHGLEIDGRCVQIAAFNVALAAWALAGSPVSLPLPHIAWVGARPSLSVSEFVALADGNTQLIGALAASRRYTLIFTNVPYLGRGKQSSELAEHIATHFPDAKADLATAMLARISRLVAVSGSLASVTPQNWLFLNSFKTLRKDFLRNYSIDFLASLGEEAWEYYGDRGPLALLSCWSNRKPIPDQAHFAADAKSIHRREDKVEFLKFGHIDKIYQKDQVENVDSVITFHKIQRGQLLGQFCKSVEGLSSGDADRFCRCFWEVSWKQHGFVPYQGTPDRPGYYSGLSLVLRWENGSGELAFSPGARVQGHAAWGKRGILIGMMRYLPSSIYLGEIHEKRLMHEGPVALYAVRSSVPASLGGSAD